MCGSIIQDNHPSKALVSWLNIPFNLTRRVCYIQNLSRNQTPHSPWARSPNSGYRYPLRRRRLTDICDKLYVYRVKKYVMALGNSSFWFILPIILNSMNSTCNRVRLKQIFEHLILVKVFYCVSNNLMFSNHTSVFNCLKHQVHMHGC